MFYRGPVHPVTGKREQVGNLSKTGGRNKETGHPSPEASMPSHHFKSSVTRGTPKGQATDRQLVKLPK